MNWYKKAQEIYRGDTDPISLENYDPEYAIKNLGKELGSAASYGPGIYFTSAKDIAEMYGSNITQKKLENAIIITTNDPLFSYKQIEKMLQNVDPEIIKIAVLNWDENYNNGKKMLIQSIMNADNPIEQLMNIWADVFSHQNPNDFIRLMITNGIDGISIQKDSDVYYVIYNKKVLK